MEEQKENINRRSSKTGLKSILGGSILAREEVTRQLPFVFFLALLSLVMITNRYWSEKTIRKMEAVQDSLKELKAESVIHETELMKINRPSEVLRRVQERGLDLIEPIEPAQRIKVKKLEN